MHAYGRRHGVGKPKKFLPEREAAIRYGRTHDFWTYALAHEIVHGSDTSFIFNRGKVTADTVAIRDRTFDPKILLGAACFAVKSLLQAARATANVFGWHGADQLDQLFKEATDLEERHADGS
jgi:hypothetical protein